MCLIFFPSNLPGYCDSLLQLTHIFDSFFMSLNILFLFTFARYLEALPTFVNFNEKSQLWLFSTVIMQKSKRIQAFKPQTDLLKAMIYQGDTFFPFLLWTKAETKSLDVYLQGEMLLHYHSLSSSEVQPFLSPGFISGRGLWYNSQHCESPKLCLLPPCHKR